MAHIEPVGLSEFALDPPPIRMRSCRPATALRPYVRAFAERTVHADLPAQHMPPRLETVLHFELGVPIEIRVCGSIFGAPPAAVIGPDPRMGCQLFLPAGVRSFAVFFRPTGFFRLFGVPPSIIAGSWLTPDDLSVGILSSAWITLRECSTFEQRVKTIETLLLQRVPVARTSTVVNLAEHVFSANGNVDVRKLSRHAARSRRQLHRDFVREIGIGPKYFARMARFQTALDVKLKYPSLTWRAVAHSCGYFDQAHMIYDFRQIAGTTPSHLVPQLGDSRPEALYETTAHAGAIAQ